MRHKVFVETTEGRFELRGRMRWCLDRWVVYGGVHPASYMCCEEDVLNVFVVEVAE